MLVSPVLKNFYNPVEIKLWTKEDPLPEFGEDVAIDTETELITDCNLSPPLVVTGVYNPKDNCCYITDWMNSPYLIKEICMRNITIYFANVGFDYFQLYCEELTKAVSHNKVTDVLIRAAIKELGTIGFIRSYSLVDVCKNHINYKMDKHEDKGDQAERVTFRRITPVTEDQYKYLAIDCITTYYAAIELGPQPTEYTHVKGAICLYQTEKNGFPVDRKMFDYCSKLLTDKREIYRQELIQQGFPDPLKKKEETDIQRLTRVWQDFLTSWYKSHIEEEYTLPKDLPGKNTCKKMLLYGIFYMLTGEEKSTMTRTMLSILLNPKNTLSKSEQNFLGKLAVSYDWIDPCDAVTKTGVWPLLLERFMCSEMEGKGFKDIMDDLRDVMENHPEWFTTEEPLKPTVYLQQKLEELENGSRILVFDKTPKSGKRKCSKKDKWMLDDAGVHDAFLDSYVNYQHVNKYLSSYCNEEHIRSDGRVRGHFGMVATLRSNCVGPNLQQYPSRDHEFPLKNMFVPPKGTIFVSTDYSFAELVALAECCITKYGYSVLGDIINADVCPHYFYAGVMLGLIPASVDFCKDPEKVAEIKAFLKEHVTKEQRNLAKAVNFLTRAVHIERLYCITLELLEA